jgi:hypothetical protein
MAQLNFRRSGVAMQRWVLFLLAAAMASFLAGCGGSTANVQNPPPPPPQNVTIAFQPEPRASLSVGATENVAAVVTNDPDSEGVSWELTCQVDPKNQNGLCGTLSNPHTASGSPVTYSAPATLTTNSTVVEIVALSTYSPSQNVVAPVTIGTFNGSLQAGNYVLQLQGVDGGSVPYQLAGVITIDGQGGVTGGEQTLNSSGISDNAAILNTSSYFLGGDGRGTITLNWSDSSNNTGTEIFSFVFLSNSQNPEALLSQIGLDNTGFSATGTLDLQQSTIAAPSGSYVFAMTGTDVVDNTQALAFGGVLDIAAGQTTISGVTDEFIGEKQKISDGSFAAGSQLISGPDAFGQVTLELAGYLDGIHSKPVTAILTGYIVDSGHIQLIESDNTATTTGFASTSGLAIAQASGAYGTFGNGSLSGNYTFGITGVDLYQSNLVPATLTAAGVFTADGQADGALTSGFTDTFLQLNCVQQSCKIGGIEGAQISAAFTGIYAVDSASASCGADSGTVVSGTGRACLTPANFIPGPSPSYNPQLFLYLTGLTGSSQPAALVLGLGAVGASPNLHYPWIGSGLAYAQTTATPALSGLYGASFTQENGSETDGTAQMTVNSANTPALSGTADASFQLGNGFLGIFGTATSNNLPGALYANPEAPIASVFTNQIAVDYYSIDSNQGFFVETDLVNGPYQTGQVTLGYYATQCQVTVPPTTCPTTQEVRKGKLKHK